MVATYEYVNLVIALLLGRAILAERVSPVLLSGAVLFVFAVAPVIRHESRGAPGMVQAPLAAEEGQDPAAGQSRGAASGGGVRGDASRTSAKTSPAIAASRTAQPSGSFLK